MTSGISVFFSLHAFLYIQRFQRCANSPIFPHSNVNSMRLRMLAVMFISTSPHLEDYLAHIGNQQMFV